MKPVWKIHIHKLVLSEDFRSINHSDQRLILKSIRKKLSVDPHNYGKPLLGELKGYWRLRCGDYRAIYRINLEAIEVLVIKIGIRRDEQVYRDMFQRLRRLQNH